MLEKTSRRPGRPRRNGIESRTGDGKGAETGLVSSLSKALCILTLFTVERPEWSPAQIEAETGLHRASVYRILRTMEHDHFVGIDASTGRYHLGPAMYPAAYLSRTRAELVRVAHPHVQALAESTGETANLAVDVDGWPVVVDQVLTSHIYKPVLPFGLAIGDIRSSHAKLFLALAPEGERNKRISADERLVVAGEEAIEELRREVETIHDDGIAYDIESLPGVCAISVPVYDHSGDLRASLSVVAPPQRFGAKEMKTCAEAARAEAAALSRDLGYRS